MLVNRDTFGPVYLLTDTDNLEDERDNVTQFQVAADDRHLLDLQLRDKFRPVIQHQSRALLRGSNEYKTGNERTYCFFSSSMSR